ncbi:hypothetical protein AB0E01_41530 [Nocardia vinacea]|uniref:hypothetical protein n=1 Tax=Nocardia vinacea TaxID=96468 RepID=UPI00340D79C3
MIDFPIAGDAVALSDKFLLDLGLSALWAETIEFAVLMIVFFVVLVSILGRLVPWLSKRLFEPARQLVATVPALLLAPEWVVTKLLRRFGRAPGPMVYSYGEGVFALTDGIRLFVSEALQLLGALGRFSRPIAGVVVVAGVLLWNSGSCVDSSNPCVSPVQSWVQLVGTSKDR